MNTTTSFDPWLGSEKVVPSDTGDPVRIVFGPRGVPPMPVPADASAFASVADMEAYIARLDDPDAGLPALGSSGGTCPNCHQTEVLCVGWKYRGLEDTLYRCPACAHEATAGELADANGPGPRNSPCMCDACSSERPRLREFWVNLYASNAIFAHPTPEAAEANAWRGTLETVHVREVPR